MMKIFKSKDSIKDKLNENYVYRYNCSFFC